MKDDFDLDRLRKKAGKKRINSKAKGNRFERKIADILNERFKTKDFCRSPGSGAFATTHTLPDYMKIHGDLITPKNFRYLFECKVGYEKFKFIDLLEDDSDICKIIKKAEMESSRCGKLFVVLLKNNNRDIVAITNDTLLQEKVVKNIKYGNLVILRFEDFLSIKEEFLFLN